MKLRNVMATGLLYTFMFVPAAYINADAAESLAAAPELGVAQIIERNINARGGAVAWHRVQSLSMSGKLDAGRQRVDGGKIGALTAPQSRSERKAALRKVAMNMGEESADKIIRLPFQMELKRPLKSRIEVPFQGKTALQVYDGTQGWKLRPYLGRHEVEAFSPTEAKIAAQQQELDGPLLDYAAKGTKVSLENTEQVNGRKAYKLKLTLKQGEVRHLWIDAQTFLDVKMEGAPRQFDGKPRAVYTSFQDYRTIDGVKIPYVLETSVEGSRVAEKINIEKVVINPKLDDSRFAKPI